MNDETAVAIYERIKDQGYREGAANFFGRTYGSDDCEPFSTQVQEGFSSLIPLFKQNNLHTYEGFKTAVMLPEEYIFSDGEVFNYYNYNVKSYIKEKENEQTKTESVKKYKAVCLIKLMFTLGPKIISILKICGGTIKYSI